MRLPAITNGQKHVEDSRAFNERLYAAFLAGVPIELPITKLNWREEQSRVSGNSHKFWNARGFRVRTRSDAEKTTLTVWLEQGSARRRSNVGEAMRAVRKVGPVVPSRCVECGWTSDRRRSWDTFDLGECRVCGGTMQPKPKTQALNADAKAKRELAELERAG